jgi:hypothetical protein
VTDDKAEVVGSELDRAKGLPTRPIFNLAVGGWGRKDMTKPVFPVPIWDQPSKKLQDRIKKI